MPPQPPSTRSKTARGDERIFVHATNVTGLGASQVVQAILGALARNTDHPLDCHIPAFGPFDASAASLGDHVRLIPLRRFLPNSASRLFECSLSRLYFPTCRYGITLGDIPVTNVREQVVLVHQLHLVSPHINPFAYDHLNARTMRWLFRRNLRHARCFVVQTDAIREQLEATYPEIAGRVVTVPQPAPAHFAGQAVIPRNAERLRLFYPAAGYPHKNHQLLRQMARVDGAAEPLEQLVVTLEPGEAREVAAAAPWVHNAGRLSPTECLEAYRGCDGLFFPSTAESYGLPLVEAMVLGLPVVCSDLPYARWLCGEQAVYFDPLDPRDAWRAVHELHRRLRSGWSPDWTSALAKLPSGWDEVGRVFLALLFSEPGKNPR